MKKSALTYIETVCFIAVVSLLCSVCALFWKQIINSAENYKSASNDDFYIYSLKEKVKQLVYENECDWWEKSRDLSLLKKTLTDFLDSKKATLLDFYKLNESLLYISFVFDNRESVILCSLNSYKYGDKKIE